jgi:regulator of nucleoside diphosphate kinase
LAAQQKESVIPSLEHSGEIATEHANAKRCGSSRSVNPENGGAQDPHVRPTKLYQAEIGERQMKERMIQVTQEDKKKLMALIESRMEWHTRDKEHLDMLAHELDRAEIVLSTDIPADTVTMHSHVLVRDLDTGRESTYTLVFPTDAEIAQGKISILAPIATALLGYREGDEIEWLTPGGRRRFKVIKVLYQPEAVGDELGHCSVAARRGSGEEDENVQAARLRAV